MDPRMRDYLIEQLAIEEGQVADVEGLLDLEDLWSLYDLDGHRELRDPPWQPVPKPEPGEDGQADMFAAMRAGDLLVHHPYHSFVGSVERFVQQAVADPDVLAVKMTVYRTSDDSGLVPSLIEAAERGKQTVCLVELKARFDERRNIGWARALEEAGAHVVHGPARPEDARQGAARGPARGRRPAPLRAHRHRQLPLQDGPPLRGLRALHLRPGAHRRRGRALQRAHRRSACARVPQGDRGARPHEGLVPRGGPARRSRRAWPARGADRARR